jgi:UDP-N-acetylglucosamine 2-epimerase (non-hydrolysing)
MGDGPGVASAGTVRGRMSLVGDGPRLPLLVVVGTRPEAIKLVPLILALQRSPRFRPVVMSTGQHHDMVTEVFGLAGITPDVDLLVGGRHSRLNERVASVMRRFEDYVLGSFADQHGERAAREVALAGDYPVGTIVHGDTTSAFAAALAAFHLRIPVAHIEAGLRTGGLNLTPFPEELNRQLISCIAAVHFAPTEKNEENLVRENVPASQIIVTGNTGIDALQWAAGLDVPIRDPRVAEILEGDGRVVLVTAHRRENWGGGLARIADGVARVASTQPDVRFIVPCHPNPIVHAELTPALEPLPNVLLTDPLKYTTIARVLARCTLVITDSGGLQEEAPSLGKPVLVARESTERVEGVKAGTLRLVGTDPDKIVLAATLLLDDEAEYRAMADVENPYGDGHAAERIVAAHEHLLTGTDPPTQFGAGYSRMAVLTALGYDSWLRPVAEETVDESWSEHLPVDDGE